MKKAVIMGIDFGLSKINSTLTDMNEGSLLLDSESRYTWDVQANNWMETNPEQLGLCFLENPVDPGAQAGDL